MSTQTVHSDQVCKPSLGQCEIFTQKKQWALTDSKSHVAKRGWLGIWWMWLSCRWHGQQPGGNRLRCHWPVTKAGVCESCPKVNSKVQVANACRNVPSERKCLSMASGHTHQRIVSPCYWKKIKIHLPMGKQQRQATCVRLVASNRM